VLPFLHAYVIQPTYTYSTPLYGTPVTTTTVRPPYVQNNYLEQPPTAYAEKAKERENKFLGKEIARNAKTVSQQEKREAKMLKKSQKHAERATQIVSKGGAVWRSSRHEEAAMKYQSQAQYSHNVAAEARQSIERAEVMRAMPVRGISVPATTTQTLTTIEQPILATRM